MSRTHWHVANGTPGYLFDTDEPYTFDTRSEALRFARDEAANEADQRNEAARDANNGRLPRMDRTVVTGRDTLRPGGGRDLFAGIRVMIERPANPYDLGYMWEGWSCTDSHDDDDDTVMHPVSDPGVVWYGGIGHKLLSTDGGGVECYRCGMVAEGSAWQELIPDCLGPDGGGNHHWMAHGADRIECAYGDAIALADGREHQNVKEVSR